MNLIYKFTSLATCIVAAVTLLSSSPLQAQAIEPVEDEENTTPEKPSYFSAFFGKKAWAPPPPAADDFDWIQLVSGEWLKGEITAMYNGVLEFDSEELDLQEFDFDDILQIRSGKEFSVRTNNKETHTGAMVMEDNEMRIIDESNELSTPQDKVLSIAPGQTSELSNWTARISFGANYRTGNVEQTEINTRAVIQRRTTKNRYYAELLSNFGETDGFETANDHRLNSYFDIFISTRFFIRPLNIEYIKDTFQNYDAKVTASASVGYHILTDSKSEWDVSGGPGYTFTRYISVEEGEDLETESPSFILSTNFDTDLTKSIDWNGNVRVQFNDKATGGITYHALTAFEFEITRRLDLDVSLIWDRVSNPAPSESTPEPEQDDFRLTIGIGLEM